MVVHPDLRAVSEESISDGNEIDDYYIKKYNYLKNNGWFSDYDNNKTLNPGITEDHIKKSLVNLKQLTFEVTDRCNLVCEYCGYGTLYSDYDTRDNKNMDFGYVESITRFILPYWRSETDTQHNNQVFISFYGGEPLLNIEFIKRTVEHFRSLEANRTFLFSMTTNGMLLDRYADYLVENDFYILISLDGDSEGNSYRRKHSGQDSFSTVYSNANLIKQKYPDYFKERVSFNSVLHNRNGVDNIHKFFKNNFGKVPTIAPLNSSGINRAQMEKFNAMYRVINEDELKTGGNYSTIKDDLLINLPSFDNISMFLHKMSGIFYKTFDDVFTDQNQIRCTPTGTCMPFSKRMFITVNGKIMVCERIGQEYYAGDVTNNGVNINLKKVAEQYTGYYSKLMKQCQSCYMVATCKQCMFYIDNLKDNPLCSAYQSRERHRNNLKSIFLQMEAEKDSLNKILNDVIVDF